MADMDTTFTGPDAWAEAFSVIREANRPAVVTVDGAPYKLYPSGRALCARTRPFHPFDGDTCDCHERQSGGTIATLRI